MKKQGLLGRGKRAVGAKKEVAQAEGRAIVLVGTYKSGQLAWIKRHGLYNYPIKDGDQFTEDSCRQVKELWLYADAKAIRHCFAAEFVGVQSKDEFLAANPTYAKLGSSKHERYMVFKAKWLEYGPKIETPTVVARVSDFSGGRSKKVAKAIRQFHDGGEFGSLADYLPGELAELPREQLRVCEAAVQMCFQNFTESACVPFEIVDRWDKNVESEKSSYAWTKDPVFIDRKKPLRDNMLNVLELFCGCGGTSLGFEMAGYQTVMGIDILEPAIETFRNNHKTASAFLGDINLISAEEIQKHLPDKIDVVIAGIPCQGFSLNNRKRHDTDKRNFLYLELMRILRTIRPKAVVVENVSGIRSSSQGEVPQKIEQGIFDACGLTVRHKMLHAADYGVPQKRARVVFVGVGDPAGFDFSKIQKTNGPGTDRPFVTVREAIGDLPFLESGGSVVQYDREPDCDYQRLMRKGATRLLNHSAPTHPQATIDKIAGTKPGEPMYPKFRQRIRLSWDDQSPTQVSGGIRPQFQFGHPSQARGLSIRERCRIQSFPDSFVVSGGLVQGRVQTGNAVPPLLAKAVGMALKEYL